MNYREIGEFAPSLPTGAAVISERLGTLDWCRLAKFFKGKERSNVYNVYENFRRSADENYSSVVASAMINAQLNDSPFSYEELNRLQSYYLGAYLRSCRFLKHDTNVDDIIRAGVLDLHNCYALHETEIMRLLRGHIGDLQTIDSIHAYYAYRKSLPKCDFIKWDSDFDEILQKLKSLKDLSQVPDFSLQVGLKQHFSHLYMLENHARGVMDPGSASNISESLGKSLLEEISREYSEELFEFFMSRNEGRERRFINHMEFKNLVAKCVDQTETFRTYLPQDHSSSPKFLPKSQMLEQFTQQPRTTKLPISLPLERLTKLKDQGRSASVTWVLEKIPSLMNLGVKPSGRLTLYGFVFGAGTLAGLATAKAKA